MEEKLCILIVDDEEVLREMLGNYLRQAGHEIEEADNGHAALEKLRSGQYDLALVDIRMPKMSGLTLLEKISEIHPNLPVVIITGHGTMDTAISALKLGAVDFLLKPVKLQELDAVLAKVAHVSQLRKDKSRLKQTIGFIQSTTHPRGNEGELKGVDPATQEIRKQIQLAVKGQCDTILITGDTGTGKDVVAREIHALASTPKDPFIPVSCPAIPDSLVESELFGHVMGAFTGAMEDRAGCFELAHGGSLFLDEIGDLSAAAQAKLLRVLETRMVRPLGAAREIQVKLRVIAATNVSLEDAVRNRKFRADLLYRLNVYAIHLLPLRERPKDILPLADHFLSSYAQARNLQFDGFSPEARQRLEEMDYAGNVRELRNMVERAAILRSEGRIEADDLIQMGRRTKPVSNNANPVDKKDAERKRILDALEKTKWNRREAAKTLGIPYSTLRYRIEKLNIS